MSDVGWQPDEGQCWPIFLILFFQFFVLIYHHFQFHGLTSFYFDSWFAFLLFSFTSSFLFSHYYFDLYLTETSFLSFSHYSSISHYISYSYSYSFYKPLFFTLLIPFYFSSYIFFLYISTSPCSLHPRLVFSYCFLVFFFFTSFLRLLDYDFWVCLLTTITFTNSLIQPTDLASPDHIQLPLATSFLHANKTERSYGRLIMQINALFSTKRR